MLVLEPAWLCLLWASFGIPVTQGDVEPAWLWASFGVPVMHGDVEPAWLSLLWASFGVPVTQGDVEPAPSSAPGAGGDAPLIESPPKSHQLQAKAAPGSKAQMAAQGRAFQSKRSWV